MIIELYIAYIISMNSHTCFSSIQQLIAAGVVPGSDMTPEAALTKVSYLVVKDHLSYEQKQEVEKQRLSMLVWEWLSLGGLYKWLSLGGLYKSVAVFGWAI